MELHILWLYHDIKDVFGDRGNLQVLKKRCELRHIECTVTTCGIGERVDISAYDLVYFGTNISSTDTHVLQDLFQRKDVILTAVDKGVFFLLVCGGYQAFSQRYIFPDKTMEALGICSYEVDYRKPMQAVGNVYAEASKVSETIIGFENHTYQITKNEHPFAEVKMGYGNDESLKQEGYFFRHMLGTNLHGPLLPKNPQLADWILEQSLHIRYPHAIVEPLEDFLEEKARAALLKRFKVRN